jgi:mannose-6-phosphate isomerase-like protein (cupin superfamily)
VTEPERLDFSAAAPVSHDAGVHDREIDIDGTRWALVEYEPGSGREGWCDTPHVGCVVSGVLTYSFDDDREPLTIGPGEAFLLPPSPRHRGRNGGSEPVRLFLIDALPAP